MEALVTEPSFLSSLGIVRSLAKKGIVVHVLGDSNLRGLDVSFHSRYCTERIIGPSPRKTEFVDFLVQVLEDRNIDVLIPAAYWSAEKIVKNRTKLDPLTHIEMVNAESFTVAASKKKTYELARDLGVPFPKTVYPQSYDEVEDISTNIRYPAVIKPLDEGYSHPSYPKNPEELRRITKCARNSLFPKAVSRLFRNMLRLISLIASQRCISTESVSAFSCGMN